MRISANIYRTIFNFNAFYATVYSYDDLFVLCISLFNPINENPPIIDSNLSSSVLISVYDDARTTVAVDFNHYFRLSLILIIKE